MNDNKQSQRDNEEGLMPIPSTAKPDFALENQAFETVATEMSFQLDKLPGGFYASQSTQRAWALWIHRAAIAGAEVLAARRTQKIDD